MEEIESEIKTINLKINEIELLLEKDFEEWTLKEKQKFGNHEQLRKEKEQLRDLLILKEKEKQMIASRLTATPEQVLKDLLGFEIGESVASYERPSVTLKDATMKEIGYIVPLMKFVDRQDAADALFRSLDEYLKWTKDQIGEAEKNIKFITVVGTSGKGKTTFARRFIDLPYYGNYPHIIKDCKESNRRYRVNCCDFDILKDAEAQLSLLILYQAFKHSVPQKSYKSLRDDFFEKSSNTQLSFERTLSIITKTFCLNPNLAINERLLIINLDETNELLNDDQGKKYLKRLFSILRNAAKGFTLLTILSGTHSVDLFEQVQISQCKFVDIELSLIGLEAAKEVILGMTANPEENRISPYLENVLTLCGGVGRYLEIAIIEMSIIGGAKEEFKQDCYEHFLKNLQTFRNIEYLLEKVTLKVLVHYPKLFLRFESSIELLSCYTLFQWSVRRSTKINGITLGDLEKDGVVFLQPIPSAIDWYYCIIPFITLFWALKNSRHSIEIPLLRNVDSYLSSDESENNSLRIVMAKLSGLAKKKGLIPDDSGHFTVMLSELFPLRDGQPDTIIKFHNSLDIMNSGQQINMQNYKNFKNDNAVIFCEPMIGIQEKQSVVAKKRIVDGQEPAKFNNESFQTERLKFPADGIFVLISDAKQGDIVLGEKDIFIDYESFTKFAGPLIALRKLYCMNQL